MWYVGMGRRYARLRLRGVVYCTWVTVGHTMSGDERGEKLTCVTLKSTLATLLILRHKGGITLSAKVEAHARAHNKSITMTHFALR